jgi:hypothetical protein
VGSVIYAMRPTFIESTPGRKEHLGEKNCKKSSNFQIFHPSELAVASCLFFLTKQYLNYQKIDLHLLEKLFINYVTQIGEGGGLPCC